MLFRDDIYMSDGLFSLLLPPYCQHENVIDFAFFITQYMPFAAAA